MSTKRQLKLVLEDGSMYTGTAFGAYKEQGGEVVFNTGMVGYPESFTDPSYKGQILVLTYPLIGNYGVPETPKKTDDVNSPFESSSVHINGLIVSEYSENYSHWKAKKSLHKWLEEHNVPLISGVDTRALTQKIREKGAMLGKIAFPESIVKKPFYDPNKENVVAQVCVKKPITYKRGTKHIVLIDTGVKNHIIKNFLDRNITITRVPWDYDFFGMKEKFDGICFANGPGDPMVVKPTHALMKKALEKKIPTFGICLGTQIMAIAGGGKTYKLKYGHRAQNQPCIDLRTKRCYITSQNHGFAVDGKSLPKGWKVWFENANDLSVEGIFHTTLPFFSVQFHPEATPGPLDTGWLFDEFLKLIK